MNQKDEQIIKDFITLAETSFNPDNFTDLMELLKLQYPNLLK